MKPAACAQNAIPPAGSPPSWSQLTDPLSSLHEEPEAEEEDRWHLDDRKKQEERTSVTIRERDRGRNTRP